MKKKLIITSLLALGLIFSSSVKSFAEMSGKDFVKEIFNRENPLTTFEMGTEVSHIRYAEPSFMKDKGYMYGIFSSATYRTSENNHIRSIKDIFTDENKINMFKIDGKFSWGTVDYESEGTGTIDNITDYMLELRGVTGYDISVFQSSRITPYVGFGFRYLNDDSGGETSTTGQFGYEREANYFYLPIGLETRTPFNGGWALDMIFEYDVFLGGKQKSHLGDAVAGLGIVKSEQKKGFGLRGSFKIKKETEKMDFYVEPFIRYWKIDDSEVSAITYNGVVVGFGLEPENNSTEYGIKLGLQF